MSTNSEGPSDEERARIKAERDARKEAEKSAKAAKAAEKAAAAEAQSSSAASAPPAMVSYLALDSPSTGAFGDYELFQSQGTSGRIFSNLEELVAPKAGELGAKVWLRARVQSVRAKGSSCFLVLREGAFTTAQGVIFKNKSSPEAGAGMQPLLSSFDYLSVPSAVLSCFKDDVPPDKMQTLLAS